jgi:D-glycero-D-manno-heptose 1,7-bisphosphate phosphatase
MKIAFLDRDGVINKFPGNGNYVTKVKDLHVLPRAVKAIRILTEAGYQIFVISNQAGVGRKFYSKHKLDLITKKVKEEVEKEGGKIAKFCYCIHRSDAGCHCRKPETGSLKKALKSVGKTIRSAKGKFFVGDTKSDVLTGFNAGCKTILVLSGRAKKKNVKDWGVKPDFIVKDLLAAADIILANEPVKKRILKSNHTYFTKKELKKRFKSLKSS